MTKHTRRGLAGAAAMSLLPALALARPVARLPANPTAFGTQRDCVLVHGAWAGAWGWQGVIDRLESGNIRAFAPTLTGLGERTHLLAAGVDLTTHITDIVNEIRYKDLNDIVLVGHSYGGMVITGVAEVVPERIGHIVYVDAFIPANNQSINDITGTIWPTLPDAPWATPPRTRRPEEGAGQPRQTPQPTASLSERLAVTGAYQRVAKKTFIVATGRPTPHISTIAEGLRSDPTWTVIGLPTGHGVQREDPAGVSAIIASAARKG